MKRINREWVVPNLRETAEHIQSLVQEIERGNDRESLCESLMIAIYRDLNRAWNGRHLRTIREGVADESLCRFPTDLDVAD